MHIFVTASLAEFAWIVHMPGSPEIANGDALGSAAGAVTRISTAYGRTLARMTLALAIIALALSLASLAWQGWSWWRTGPVRASLA